MKPDQTAYTINANSLEEYYFCPDIVFYGNKSFAKREALRELNFAELKDKNGDDFTFITVRVKRCKSADKYLIDGKLKTAADIEYEKQKSEKKSLLEKMLSENPDCFAYIKKGGFFYGPNNSGYTDYKIKAGIYPIKDAVSECMRTSIYDNMWPEIINPEIHNKMIDSEIERLKNKLIL